MYGDAINDVKHKKGQFLKMIWKTIFFNYEQKK